MACACHFNFVAVSSCGIPAVEVWVDGSVASGYQRPAWLAPPRGGGDDGLETVGCVHHLRSRHESGLLSGHVSREVFMKLRRVKVGEAVCGLLDHSRLAEVTGKALSVVGFVLSSIRHVRSDVTQAGNRRIGPRFGNHCASIAVCDENAWPILLSEDALRRSHIFLKGRLRLLHNADVEAIFNKNVVNALPSGSVCPSAMHQNNIPNAMLLCLCGCGLR